MKERLTSLSRFFKWSWIVPAILVAIGLGLFGLSIGATTVYEATRLDLLNQQNQLQKELAELMVVKEPDVKQVQAKVYSASVAGNRVATLQNMYPRAIAGMTQNPKTHEDLQAELRTYFDGVTDAHMPWLLVGADKPYTWVFTTNHEVGSETIPTLFLCYADANDPLSLVAYVQADYNGTKELFTSRTVVITTHGMDYFSDAPSNDTTPDNQNLHGKPTPGDGSQAPTPSEPSVDTPSEPQTPTEGGSSDVVNP